MKALVFTGAMAVLLTLPLAYAQQEASSNQQDAGPEMKQGMSHDMGQNQGKGMMDRGDMQQRMQGMHGTMQQLHNTQDPQQRRQLMQQHMQEMQQMHQSMGGMMNGGMGQNMQNMDPEERQEMMQQRMDMMQGMQQQMMEHMQAQQAMQNDSE